MDQSADPIQFSVDYPDRPLDRLKTLFRPLAAIPILIVLGPLLKIVTRRTYPRWWFDAIPHYVVLAGLNLAAVVAVIVAHP